MNEALRQELAADGHAAIKTTIVCPFHVDTELFKDKVRWNFQRLLPTLSQDRVAAAIITAIEDGTSAVFLPRIMALVPALRFLPTPIYDSVHRVHGQSL